MQIRRSIGTALLSLGVIASAHAVQAEEIIVSTYGAATQGFPYAIAMEKGFFEEAGANVTSIIATSGGGTTIRNLLGSDLAFADTSLSAAVPAILNGADLKIIAATTNSLAEFVWAAKLDSAIKTIDDLKGKKIGFTNPRSTTEAAALLLLEALEIDRSEVELVKTGGLGEGLSALDLGLIDVMPILEPSWSEKGGKYRAVATGELLPRMTTNVAVTTGKAAADQADFIRAVLDGRRKAIEFMATNTDEASEIIARTHRISVGAAKSALMHLLESEEKMGTPYFGLGRFDMVALNNMIRAQKMVGALSEDPDWSTMLDEQFLPDDQKGGAE